MELEELKNNWLSLEERLSKQENLKASIIKEMIHNKANKSVKRLFWSDSVSIPVLLLLVPFLVYAYEKFGGKHILWDATVLFGGTFCIVYLPFLIYRIYGLMKIDISESIKNNLFYINRYNIQIKREKFLTVFLCPVVFILVSLTFIESKANAFLWTFWICVFIFLMLYSYWSYNKFYRNNILSIRKSLEELKELEEE